MMMMVVVAVHALSQRGHGGLSGGQVAGLKGGRQRAERTRRRGAWAAGELILQLRRVLEQRGKILLGAGDIAGLQVAGQ